MTGWQKALYALVGALILLAFVPSALSPDPPRLELTVLVQAGAFVPSAILIPSYGTVVNLTIRNNDSSLTPTFTVASATADVIHRDLTFSVNVTVEFTVVGPNRVAYNGTEYTVNGVGGVGFVSRTGTGLSGLIVVGVPPPDPDLMPVVYFRINATEVDGNTAFEPSTLRLPQHPARVHVRVVALVALPHTFSLRTPGGEVRNYWMNDTGDMVEVTFDVFAPGQIVLGGVTLTVEQEGGGTRFFCGPHETAGMVGKFVVGAEPVAVKPVENGVFLRAYWIGLVGIFATILLTIVAYWVIKGQSVHHVDHSGHVRRGLP